MEDREIVQLYWDRNPDAISESSEKYGDYCFAVADNLLCNAQDAEECVNDTFLGAWDSIPPNRPERLKLFLAKITRRTAFNRWRSRTAQKRGGGVQCRRLRPGGERTGLRAGGLCPAVCERPVSTGEKRVCRPVLFHRACGKGG